MRQTWIVVTGAGIIAVGLVFGSLAWSGAVPGAQAMDFMNSLAQMHGPGHNQMHGDANHDRMHEECDGDMTMAEHHEQMGDRADCPHGSTIHGMMGRIGQMMHHSDGHMTHHRGHHADCPMFDLDT